MCPGTDVGKELRLNPSRQGQDLQSMTDAADIMRGLISHPRK